MAQPSPFQSAAQQDTTSKENPFSDFRMMLQRMQRTIRNNIFIIKNDLITKEATKQNAADPSPAPKFAPLAPARHDSTKIPGISDPRFRPKLPADPQEKTREVQAGPETMTDAPKEKPLQAPPDLVNAVITQESGGDPNAVSVKGAIGLMQIMPSTATDPGFGIAPIPVEKLTNAAANKKFGTEYLSAMLNRYNGDTRRALIAFNAGHTIADRFTGDLSSLPAETQNYVARIEATLGKRAAEALSAPGTPATAPLGIPVPATGTQEPVAPQAPSTARRVAPPRRAPASVGPPAMAQAPTPPPTRRQASVPVIWQQAVTKFLQSRDPEDLSVVPKGSMPVILALMGQSARRPPL